MAMSSNDKLDERKIEKIKYNILKLETDNVVKKESNPAMIDKIQRMIMTEVDKKL